MKNSKIAVSLAFIFSSATYAGSSGVEITQAQFQDYLVYVANSGCGGQLVAGKFVITAAHCVGDFGVAQSAQWNDISSDGLLTDAQVSAINPRVIFGSANKTTGTEYVYRYQHDSNARSSYLEQVTADFMTQTSVVDGDLLWGKPHLAGDIMIYELSTPVLQQSAAILLNSNTNLSDQADVKWTGWGATLSDQTGFPDVAHAGLISYSVYPYSNWSQLIGFNIDIEKATTKNGSNICSGDSGSPLTVNGKVLGYVSSSTLACGDTGSVASLTSASFYLPWIAAQINSVNTVSKKELKVTSAGTHSVTWTIPVQNLKTTDVTFTPELIDTTGLFSSNDLSNCEGTFTTGSSCEISVTFNAAGAQVANNVTATLKLNSEVSIPLSYLIQTPIPAPNNGGNSGGSSGGGSTSPYVLAGMLALSLAKRITCRKQNK
jgi:hypothetical protein